MSSLILNSLEIHNFRAFHHLKIDRLARVNLIVGKNNIGKTCLLEALALYFHPSPSLLWDILETRKEGRRPTLGREIGIAEQLEAIKHLFYGRRDLLQHTMRLQIGSPDAPHEHLSITIEYSREEQDEQGQAHVRPLQSQPDITLAGETPIPMLTLQRGDQRKVFCHFRDFWVMHATRKTNCLVIPTQGLEAWRIAGLWNDILRSDLEQDVLGALQIIAPEVEALLLTGGQEMMAELVPMVKLRNQHTPIRLSSMGEGMNRIFGIVLALVNVKGGLLLIDEIESSLHHTVHTELWNLIFKMAQQLNIQVFITTHSWDCIKGFQQAAQATDAAEGLLISLRSRPEQPGHVVALLFDKPKMAIITRDEIEVR
jgi:ABC-type molybdenum transport system ATPase subunit/photorepair protein PhrA